MPDSPFSPDYATARARFRAAADRLGWIRSEHPIGLDGPDGSPLTIDVAVSSPDGREPAVVLSGGVHGVEGFVGSAVQLAAMQAWAERGAPKGVRVVFVHAVSPFGFAHLRRFDESNVDPNRNFLLDGERFEGSPPLYARLDPVLNPQRPPPRVNLFVPRAIVSIARHGFAPLKQAIAQGQYDHPRGMFFGGHAPSRSQQVLRQHLPDWLADAPAVVHLDVHTGLGRWATYKLLIDPPLTPDQHARAAKWFGAEHLQASNTNGVAYETRGGFGGWCQAVSPGRDYLYLCAEFGTYGNLSVLSGVRAENQAHHWADPASAAMRRAKARLKELFCPASPRWRARVVEQGVRLVRDAAAGLAACGI